MTCQCLLFLQHLLRQVIFISYLFRWCCLTSKQRISMLGLWLVIEWINILERMEGGRGGARKGGGRVCSQSDIERGNTGSGTGTHTCAHTQAGVQTQCRKLKWGQPHMGSYIRTCHGCESTSGVTTYLPKSCAIHLLLKALIFYSILWGTQAKEMSKRVNWSGYMHT